MTTNYQSKRKNKKHKIIVFISILIPIVILCLILFPSRSFQTMIVVLHLPNRIGCYFQGGVYRERPGFWSPYTYYGCVKKYTDGGKECENGKECLSGICSVVFDTPKQRPDGRYYGFCKTYLPFSEAKFFIKYDPICLETVIEDSKIAKRNDCMY